MVQLTVVVDLAGERGGHGLGDLLYGDAGTRQAVCAHPHLPIRPYRQYGLSAPVTCALVRTPWHRTEGYVCGDCGERTLSYDLPERVVADNPNLLR